MDPDVTTIIHDHNSYGGEAAGCFELGADIRNSRGTKPIIAVVDSNSYSASYALSSAADKIVVTPSGGVGSVGVVAMHVDVSKMMEKFGVAITFIHSGDHKVDGNPYEELSADVKADIQKSVDKSRDAFVKLVSTNLGLDSKVIYDTQARTYRADDALALGLVHAVAAPGQALRAIDDAEEPDESGELAKTSTVKNEEDMDPKENADKQNQAADAKSQERARVKAITTCEAAKGREELANYFAYDTDMSAEQAQAALAKAPLQQAAAQEKKDEGKEQANGGKSNFEQAMNKIAHPEVGANDQGRANNGEKLTGEARVDAIFKNYERATGFKSEQS